MISYLLFLLFGLCVTNLHADDATLKTAESVISYVAEHDVHLLMGKKNPADVIANRKECDARLEKFIIAFTGTVAHAESIKVRNDIERLGAYNVALVTAAQNESSFFNNFNNVSRSVHTLEREFLALLKRKFVTDREIKENLLAASLRVFLDHLVRLVMHVENSKKKAEALLLFRHAYFFVAVSEIDRFGELYKKSVKGLRPAELETKKSSKKAFSVLFDGLEDFKEENVFENDDVSKIGPSILTFQKFAINFLGQPEINAAGQDGVSLAEKISKDQLTTFLFRLGLLFSRYAEFFRGVRMVILNPSSYSDDVVSEGKQFFLSMLRTMMRVQNIIENKRVGKTDLRTLFNNTLGTAVKYELFSLSGDLLPYREASARVKRGEFCLPIYSLLLLFVRKNVLEIARHVKNVKAIKASLLTTMSTVGLAIGAIVMPGAAGAAKTILKIEAVRRGSEALESSLKQAWKKASASSGNEIWAQMHDVYEGKEQYGSKLAQVKAEVKGYIDILFKFVTAWTDQVKQEMRKESEIFLVRDRAGRKVTEMRVTKAVSDIALKEVSGASSVPKKKTVSDEAFVDLREEVDALKKEVRSIKKNER
jgi:hypothetical protein